MFTKGQSFYKGSAILIGMVVVTKVIGLVFKLTITNLLGGTGMAYYSSVYAVFTPVYAIAIGGIPSAIAIMTAENFALGRYKNARKIRSTAFMLFTSLGLVITLLFIAFAELISGLVFSSHSLAAGLMAVAPTVLLCCIISVYRGYSEGLLDMVPTAVSEIIETAFKLILGLGAAFFTYNKLNGRISEERVLSLTAASAILGASMSSLFACIYLFIRLKVKGDGITPKMLEKDKCTDSRRKIVRELLHYALPIAMTTAISTLMGMIDLFTVPIILRSLIERGAFDLTALNGSGLSRESIPEFVYGSYTALALTVTGMIPGLTAMPCKSALPNVSKSRAKGDTKGIERGVNDIMFISSLMAFPASFGMTVFSKEILLFLFPSRVYETAVSVYPMIILSSGLVFGCFLPPVFALLQAVGRPESTVRIMLISCGVKLIMNLVLLNIPIINISGAAASVVISDLTAFIIAMRMLIRQTGIVLDDKRVFFAPMFASILCAAGARLCYDRLSAVTETVALRPKLTLCIAIGSIIYIFSLYLLNILPKNRINRKNIKKFAKRA